MPLRDRAAYMRAYRAAHPEIARRERVRSRFRGARPRKPRPFTEEDRERIAALPRRSGKASKFSRVRFIGIDGEGMTIGGEHRYVLLASSDGRRLVDLAGIGTLAALDFLCETKRLGGSRGVLVCYGASYDVNMILGGLDRDQVKCLWEGQEVGHGRYRLRYRPRKSFEALRVGMPEWLRRKGRWVRNVEASFVLWDVIGFFQSTFLAAMDEWLTLDERRALDAGRIEAGKRRRSSFAIQDQAEIEKYTAAELRALVVLMHRLRDHLSEAGLSVSRWDGAGAVAAALLRREGVKDHIGAVSDDIERIGQHAYFGGRIEAVRYGTARTAVHQYDLRSAYPAAMTKLPSLSGGQWYGHLPCDLSENGFSMVRVRWTLVAAHEVFPFPYRDRFGEISYPPQGEGWVWWPEYEAAYQAMVMRRYERGSEITMLEGRCFHPSVPGRRPFAFVPELYDLRARWKREGRGAEKVLKLGLNSLYGKMAQQIGYRAEEGARETRRPPYHSLPWAGYVTSLTRARCYSAAMQAPEAVVMFATDAIFTLRALELDIGTGLGEWEALRHKGIVVAQSGVYWTMTDEGPAEHSRGFDRGALDPSAIRAAWANRARTLRAPATRFVTMGAALDSGDDPLCQVRDCPYSKRRHKVFRHWRTWRTTSRDLSLGPEGKRQPIPGMVARPAETLVLTRARAETVVSHGCCIGSAPYPLLWRGEELSPMPSEDGSPLHLLLADIDEAQV